VRDHRPVITGEGDGVDLGIPRRVHPALAVRVTDTGAAVVPLDAQLETRQEYDRLTYAQLARVIPLSGMRTALVARLVPGTQVVPAQLVAEIAGGDPDVCHDLEAFCVDLVGGGLLEQPPGGPEREAPHRLAGYSEPAPDLDIPEIADDQLLAVRVPIPLVPDGSRFVLHGHDGTVRARFDADEIRALACLVPVGTIDGAATRRQQTGPGGRTEDEERRTLRRWCASSRCSTWWSSSTRRRTCSTRRSATRRSPGPDLRRCSRPRPRRYVTSGRVVRMR
jgi:hypothetical protein